MSPSDALRVAFVPGVTPDRWARRFRERDSGRLELVPIPEDHQDEVLCSATADMVLARLPIPTEGRHLVRLYEERPVVVVAADHLLSLADEVTTVDLDDEQLLAPQRAGWRPGAAQRHWPAMSTAQAVEVASTGAGIVVLPMSLARLHHRRDAIHRPVLDLPGTEVALVWSVERDDETTQAFVAAVRGRTSRSSRG